MRSRVARNCASPKGRPAHLLLVLWVGALAGFAVPALAQVSVSTVSGGAVTLTAGSERCLGVGMTGRVCTMEIVHGRTIPACFAAIRVTSVGSGRASAQVTSGEAGKIRPGNQVEIPSLPATCAPASPVPKRVEAAAPKPTPTPAPTPAPRLDPQPLLRQAHSLASGGAHDLALEIYRRLEREFSGERAGTEAAAGLRECEAALRARTCPSPKARRDSERSAALANAARVELDEGKPAQALSSAVRSLASDPCNPVAVELRDQAARLVPAPDSWSDSVRGLEYRLVRADPSGFSMGCTITDSSCAEDERPAHAVRLASSYYLAATETTRGQYRLCAIAGACTLPKDWAASDSAETEQPIAGVTWAEASTFCAWAGAKLPTEAEWEHAARGGGQNRPFPVTGSISHETANYGAPRCCFGSTEGADRFLKTAPVASFPEGPFGLRDLAGNVGEWTADFYGPYEAASVSNPKGPPIGSLRVTRGGSWIHPQERLRGSDRQPLDPALRLSTVGFRCARDDVPRY